MPLTIKEKELVNIGASVATGCKPCIDYHFQKVKLTNAAQAIRRRGTITIRTFSQDSDVYIEITDTGVGIPCERMKGLFEPAFTKEGSRMKAGLGLFTSYSIVQKHRGQIKATSEPGKGSTFTVILPVELQPSTERSEPEDPAGRAHRCDRLSN